MHVLGFRRIVIISAQNSLLMSVCLHTTHFREKPQILLSVLLSEAINLMIPIPLQALLVDGIFLVE